MKLITVKQLMKKSKAALIRKITKSLKAMPKKKLAILCYEMTKSKLPRLRTTKQKALPKRKRKRPTWQEQGKKLDPRIYSIKDRYEAGELFKPKRKRKFSKKQLAAQRLFAKRARAGTLRR